MTDAYLEEEKCHEAKWIIFNLFLPDLVSFVWFLFNVNLRLHLT